MTDEAATALSNNPRPIDLDQERMDALAKTADEWLAKVPEITSAEVAARAVDFDEQLLRALQETDKHRAAERKPHADAADAVQAAYKPILERGTICRELLKARLAGWYRREQQRLDAERAEKQRQAQEAERKAQEAARAAENPKTVADVERATRAAEAASEAAKAAAAVPQRSQVRGAVSGRARSLRREWRALITDRADFIGWLMENREREINEWLIETAGKLMRAGVREIDGVEIKQVEV